jgi:hypothetical protein
MTIQTINGAYMEWPRLREVNANLANANFVIDASGERVAVVFQVPKSGNIDRAVFSTGTVTAADTIRMRLETVDLTNGDPTGTLYGSSTAGTQAAPASDTTYEVTFGTAATATAGDIVALVVDFNSFTSGNLQIRHIGAGAGGSVSGLPYVDHFTTAWSKSQTTTPMCAIRYDDGTYEYIGAIGTQQMVATTVGTGSTPDELGNLFTLPFTARASGFRVALDLDGDTDIILYDGSDNVLMSASVDKETRGFANFSYFELLKPSSAWVTLSANTNYRLVAKPTTATAIGMRELVVASSGMRSQLPGGSTMQKTSRSDAGAWTDVDTRQVFGLSILFSGFDDATGGSGGGALVAGGLHPIGSGIAA